MIRLSRRSLLVGAGTGLAAMFARPGRAADERKLVLWWNPGGWDPTFTIDPHPESAAISGDPEAESATVGGIPIADASSRPAVRAFFERWGSRTAVVNGISVGSISHEACTRRMLTGANDPRGSDVLALAASALGGALPLPHAALGGPRQPGSLAAASSDVSADLAGILQGTTPVPALDPAREDAVASWLAAEVAAGRGAAPGARADDHARSVTRVSELRAFASDFSAGTTDDVAARISLAVTLLSRGLSSAVSLESPRPPNYDWDSHTSNSAAQTACWQEGMLRLGELLSAIEAVDGGALLSRTVVLALSEMGRSPFLNAAAGKDHWPVTSAMVIGGGVRGGTVLGATDDVLQARRVDLSSGAVDDGGERLTPANLLAGTLVGLELDPGPFLPGVTPLGGLFNG